VVHQVGGVRVDPMTNQMGIFFINVIRRDSASRGGHPSATGYSVRIFDGHVDGPWR